MDLWVRSQDKLLLTKVDFILVNGLDIFNQNKLIGTYSTYERALEVLDEIEDLMRSLNSSDLKIIIYEMPKE